ncbi:MULTISPECIES: HAD-IA family hydrolase [unclassified Enterococcus]|uniref:HAD-IA family hydrolase n=1 Tax=unclassified Enterococcus TaxID=2608891 RepID=UPI00247717FD|nr:MULTISPECIES: HAD-IA family hydrolase [unclassified Enterococcus]
MKHFIWDFDGTLYDTYTAIVTAAEKTFQDFEITIDKKEIYRKLKQTSLHDLQVVYGLSKNTFDPIFHDYEAEFDYLNVPFAETAEVLTKLSAAGGQHFIFTHRKLHLTEELLVNNHLEQHFVEVIGADSGFARKPEPDGINYLMEKYQLSPAETLMIGDRKLDILAGKNAGVKTCLYDIDGFLGEVPADYTVTNLKEILKINQ